MSTEPELVEAARPEGHNWLPLAIAAAVVLVAGAVLFFGLEHGRKTATVTAPDAPLDPYAASLEISQVAMSESGNLAGGKVTYLDGHIRNLGGQIVSGVTVQVLFRSYTKEIAQNDTQSVKIIRTREPYIDTEPFSAAPLKPGSEREFRLIFDRVTPEWDGAYPELRILKVNQ